MRYPAHFPDDHPDDPRVYVPNIEFYITNVCNLACPQCNRFNDYNFTGFQKWSDYEEQYTEWSKKIRLQKVVILGGEPLLNPTICEWIIGLNKLWNKKINILTNGTRLNYVPGLYEALLNFREEDGNWIGISIHNANDVDKHFEEVRKFLKGPLEFYKKDDVTPQGDSLTWGADYAFVDSNGVHVHLYHQDSFYKAAIQKNNLGELTLHQSDPEEAHSECGFVQYQCHHFIKAKLYKCGPVALFPEFDEQHHLDITDEDRMLLNSYRALSVDEFDTRGQKFIDEIDDIIPQCKFCPSNRTKNQVIESLNKVKNATSSFNIRR